MRGSVYLRPCLVSAEEYQTRRVIEKVIAENWGSSVKYEIEEDTLVPDVTGYIPDATYLASNAKWRDKPFGAVNTMERSGSLIFVAKHILDYYGICTTMKALTDQVVERGYRAWKFERSSKTFYAPIVTLAEALEAMPDGVNKDKITTLDEAFERVGAPIGIGGMHVLLDNLIGYYAKRRPVQETRLLWVQDVYQELQEGRMVPMRVENSMYWQDPMRPGGHFVILVAIHNQEALVLDSNVGERKLPIHRLLQAATVAWKVCPRR